MKSMVQHATKAKKCRRTFNEDQILNLREHSNQLSSAKKRKRESERYKKLKEKGILKYNAAERSMKYKNRKVEAAEWYLKRQQVIKMRYDKDKMALNYINNKASISQKI